MKLNHWSRTVACLTAGLLLAAGVARAESYPSKPINLVVPFAPGGGVDLIARVLGPQLAAQMGQPVIIENKPGASANIGAAFVAKAAPDGYTILLAANGLAANATLFPNAPFNPLKDFAPLAKVGFAPLVVIVAQNSPLKSLKDLIDTAKKNPKALTFASAGNGSSQHLAGEMLKMVAHIDALHVPYKGGAPAMTDILGGRISFMVQNPLEAMPLLNGHQLRALAVASDKRLALLPDVPTAAQAGLPGYEASVWWGFVAPAKTPKAIVDRLNAEIVKALNDPKTREKLVKMGVVVEPSTSEQFGVFLKSEVAKWAKVVKTAHIRVN
ncbi:tripartite tricarboxylate transporter family receptor [mine drainage metagenome]|uniref:Tripartite tricarboxylate transporter family receptor n=1 Tax=mine drainage metagenome TaxID=410659 RepID=A0A1J5R680_9ZZZZ